MRSCSQDIKCFAITFNIKTRECRSFTADVSSTLTQSVDINYWSANECRGWFDIYVCFVVDYAYNFYKYIHLYKAYVFDYTLNFIYKYIHMYKALVVDYTLNFHI